MSYHLHKYNTPFLDDSYSLRDLILCALEFSYSHEINFYVKEKSFAHKKIQMSVNTFINSILDNSCVLSVYKCGIKELDNADYKYHGVVKVFTEDRKYTLNINLSEGEFDIIGEKYGFTEEF